MSSHWVVPAVTAVMLVLAAWDAGYLYRGRHRGVYREGSEWHPPLWGLRADGSVIFNGSVYIPDYPDSSATLVVDPAVVNGVVTTLAYPRECSGRIGEFGDSAFDRSDPAPLRPFLPDGCLGDIGEEWVEIGALD